MTLKKIQFIFIQAQPERHEKCSVSVAVQVQNQSHIGYRRGEKRKDRKEGKV